MILRTQHSLGADYVNHNHRFSGTALLRVMCIWCMMGCMRVLLCFVQSVCALCGLWNAISRSLYATNLLIIVTQIARAYHTRGAAKVSTQNITIYLRNYDNRRRVCLCDSSIIDITNRLKSLVISIQCIRRENRLW